MSFTPDGNRAMMYVAQGKKELAKAKMMGLPVSMGTYNGFQVRATNLSGVQKVSVKSPMGAAVVCSKAGTMELFTADYWLGGFTKGRALSVADLALGVGLEWDVKWGESDEDIAVKELVPSTITTSGNTNRHSLPLIMPTGGEAFWVGLRTYADGHLFELCRNFYLDSGKGLKRYGDMRLFSSVLDLTFYQLLPTNGRYRLIEHYLDNTFDPNRPMYPLNGAGKLVYADHTEWDKGTGPASTDLLAEDLFQAMTPFVRDKVLGFSILTGAQGNFSRAIAVGGYALAPDADTVETMLHAAIIPLPITYDSGLDTYFTDNPAEKKWLLFFAFRANNITTLFAADSFLSVLDTMAGGAILSGATDYELAQKCLRQLFPRPNYQQDAPHDSTMFDDGASIYTWTRKYGAFKFSALGLEAVSLLIPDEVTLSEGVRPDITYSGNGLFICSCEKVSDDNKTEIVAAYKGSPFTGWVKLTDPVNMTLVHTRPTLVTAETEVILGVAKVDVGTTTPAWEYYFTAYVGGAWRKLGEIAGSEDATWAVSVFGDGALSKSLLDYPGKPPILMQMPYLPYSQYAGLQP